MVGVAQGTHTSWLSGSAQTWNPEAADAVCQQLNCGTATSFASILNQKNEKIWNVAYNCSKNKTSLFTCDNTSMPSDHENTVANVTCSGNENTSIQTHTADFGGCSLPPSISLQASDVVSSCYCGSHNRRHHGEPDPRLLGPRQCVSGHQMWWRVQRLLVPEPVQHAVPKPELWETGPEHHQPGILPRGAHQQLPPRHTHQRFKPERHGGQQQQLQQKASICCLLR